MVEDQAFNAMDSGIPMKIGCGLGEGKALN
jgi:hypothetical protein